MPDTSDVGAQRLDITVTSSIYLTSANLNRQIEVELSGQVTAAGRLAPILTIPFRVRQANAPETAQLRLVSLIVEASCDGELLGDGRVAGMTLWQRGVNTVTVRIPTSHRMLEWTRDSVARNRACTLQFRIYGAIQFRDNQQEPWTDEDLRYSSDAGTITIARSDWHDHVLNEVRQADYLYLEVEIPRDSPQEWENALALLQQAEHAYTLSDDSGVFQNLRGCLDALPGAKKAILDAVTDTRKRKAIDQLLLEFGNYLHCGRHVAQADSAEAGTFPVDRVDAGFAIASTKVFLSYISAARPVRPHPGAAG